MTCLDKTYTVNLKSTSPLNAKTVNCKNLLSWPLNRSSTQTQQRQIDTKKCFELQLLSNNASDCWCFLLGTTNVSTMQIRIQIIIKISIRKDKGEPLLHGESISNKLNKVV